MAIAFVSTMSSTGSSAAAIAAWPWFSENGILETTQVLLLSVMLWRYLRLARRHRGVLRAVFAGTALITVACLLREAEFDPEGSLGWVDRFLKGPVRVMAVVVAIPVGIYSIRGVLAAPLVVPRLVLGNRWGWTAVLGGILVVVGALYDRAVIPSDHPRAWEEALETSGYLLIAVSTFMPARVANAAVSMPSPKAARGGSRTTNEAADDAARRRSPACPVRAIDRDLGAGDGSSDAT